MKAMPSEVDLTSFAPLEARLGGAGSTRIQEVRRAALGRFVELGFPTQRLEAWRHTDVAPIAGLRFAAPPPDGTARFDAARALRLALARLPGSRAVFVNGRHAPALSSQEGLPAGVRVQSLAAALAADGTLLEQHLTHHARHEEHAFAALNTAYWEDGAYIRVPEGQVVQEPIQLVFISTAPAEPTAIFPRLLVLAGEASQVTILETHLGVPESGTAGSAAREAGEGLGGVARRSPYLTVPVAEIVLGPNAVLEHCKVQRETQDAFHVALLQAHLERGSRFTSHSFAFGATLARHEVGVLLDGEGAECTLNGLYVSGGQQQLDNQTFVDHARPHGTSRQLFKGILAGSARGVFNGGVRVRKDAQKTDAKQTNKNLILSEGALVDTKPQLEILADDVRCTHGATIGRLDEDALFYLRARGIDAGEARRILTFAFAEEVLARLTLEPLRGAVAGVLRRRLARVLASEETR